MALTIEGSRNFLDDTRKDNDGSIIMAVDRAGEWFIVLGGEAAAKADGAGALSFVPYPAMGRSHRNGRFLRQPVCATGGT